jgi:hypothetical protein
MARGACPALLGISPSPHARYENYIFIGVFIKLGFTTGNENRGASGGWVHPLAKHPALLGAPPAFNFIFKGEIE